MLAQEGEWFMFFFCCRRGKQRDFVFFFSPSPSSPSPSCRPTYPGCSRVSRALFLLAFAPSLARDGRGLRRGFSSVRDSWNFPWLGGEIQRSFCIESLVSCTCSCLFALSLSRPPPPSPATAASLEKTFVASLLFGLRPPLESPPFNATGSIWPFSRDPGVCRGKKSEVLCRPRGLICRR